MALDPCVVGINFSFIHPCFHVWLLGLAPTCQINLSDVVIDKLSHGPGGELWVMGLEDLGDYFIAPSSAGSRLAQGRQWTLPVRSNGPALLYPSTCHRDKHRLDKCKVGREGFWMIKWRFHFYDKQTKSLLLPSVFWLEPKWSSSSFFFFFSLSKNVDSWDSQPSWMAFSFSWYWEKGDPFRSLQRYSLFFLETPHGIKDANLCIFTGN